jgi:hypothetical protein
MLFNCLISLNLAAVLKAFCFYSEVLTEPFNVTLKSSLTAAVTPPKTASHRGEQFCPPVLQDPSSQRLVKADTELLALDL